MLSHLRASLSSFFSSCHLPQPFQCINTLFDNARSWYCSLPLFTRLLFTFNILLYIACLYFGVLTATWCNGPLAFYNVYDEHPNVTPGAAYRLVTASFVHGGILHVFFNMLCLQGVGSHIERLMGSFLYIWLIFLFTILGALLENICGFLLYYIPFIGSDYFVNFCSIGFSGVLFSLIVLVSRFSVMPTISLFGFIQVPRTVYPWALLLFLSMIFPSISFLGHLSGIIAGYLYTLGLLNPIIPSIGFVSSLESSTSRLFSWITTLPGYIFNTANGRPIENGQVLPVPNLVQTVSDATTSTIAAVTFQPFSGEGHKLGSRSEQVEKLNNVV